MELSPASLTVADRYKLLIGAIVPRPIALVSTLNSDGSRNLAPFSFFAGVSSEPMSLVFCPANKPGGEMKDTLRNVLTRELARELGVAASVAAGEFVVNIVPRAIAQRMAACAEDLEYGVSEFELSKLTPAACRVVKPARVLESPVSFECRTLQVVRLAPGIGSGGNMVVGVVEHVHVRDDAINDRLHIDPGQLDAIGRLGGTGYCTTRERFEMPMGRSALDPKHR